MNPHIGDVGNAGVGEEDVAGGDVVPLAGTIATLLRERGVAEERVGQADADVGVGVGRQLRRCHRATADVAGVVPVGRKDDVDAADVQAPARRFVKKTRPFTHHSLFIFKKKITKMKMQRCNLFHFIQKFI